jgi:hypothetical protein
MLDESIGTGLAVGRLTAGVFPTLQVNDYSTPKATERNTAWV